MSFDKIFDLTAGVYFNFYDDVILTCDCTTIVLVLNVLILRRVGGMIPGQLFQTVGAFSKYTSSFLFLV